MKTYDARKILSELKDVHGFVSADDEKTLDLISKMVAGKPKVQADPRFLENLRSRLLTEAVSPTASPWWKTWQSFAKFLSVPVALAGIAAIAGTLGIFEVTKPGTTPATIKYPVAATFTDSDDTSADETGVPAVQAPQASDSLPSLRGPAGTKTETSEKSAVKSAPIPNVATPSQAIRDDRTLESVDSGISNIVGDAAESSASDAPTADSMGFSAPMAMTAPAGGGALKMGVPSNVAITEYRYSFVGELPKITAPLPAYERVPKSVLPTFTKASDMGMAVSQDTGNGYSNVMRDYEKWPETPCQEEPCGKLLKESDVPADPVIIGIATGFAGDMGIDLSGYGTPVVDHSWKSALSQTSDPSFKIVPENLTVVFPRMIGRFEIWDDSGYPVGITFIVNHPAKRVQQAIGIETSTLVQTSAVAEIDRESVTARLSNGGNATAPASESGATVVEIPMVRAKIGYSLQYAEKNGKWTEFYVPSAVFETDKVPKA